MGADLGERWVSGPVRLGSLPRDSPLFPARSGAPVVRRAHPPFPSVRFGPPRRGGRTTVGRMKVRHNVRAVLLDGGQLVFLAEDGRAAPPTTRLSVGASKLKMPTLKRLFAVK